jgi:predicted DNA-binding transcriptional regulator AlpA
MTKPRPTPRRKPARTPNTTRLVDARELAEIVHVSPWTVYGWARARRIPSIRPTPRILRFDLDRVLAVLAKGGAR